MKKSVFGLVVAGLTSAFTLTFTLLTPSAVLAIAYKDDFNNSWDILGTDEGGPNGEKRWWVQPRNAPPPFPPYEPFTKEDLTQPKASDFAGLIPGGWDPADFSDPESPLSKATPVPFDISGSGTIIGSITGIGLGVGLKRLKSKKNINLEDSKNS